MSDDNIRIDAGYVQTMINTDERQLLRGRFSRLTLDTIIDVFKAKVIAHDEKTLVYLLRIVKAMCALTDSDVDMAVYRNIFSILQSYYPKLPSQEGERYFQIITQAAGSKETYTSLLLLLRDAIKDPSASGFYYQAPQEIPG